MEELLEATVRQRQVEFGPAPRMPNPMRARLHREIARGQSATESPPRQSWLAAFWPQISVIPAVAAVLLVSSALWLKNERPGEQVALRLATRAPVEADAAAPLQSLEVAPVDEPLLDFVEPEIAAAAPTIASVAPPAAAAAAPPITAARGFVASPPVEKMDGRQRFSQNAVRANQGAHILNTFDLHQEGQQIRVVDEDGSTYTGTLEPIARNEARAGARESLWYAPAKEKKESADSIEFRFRAVGFNVRVQKQVVFEGNYFATPAVEEKQSRADAVARETHTPARIIGTARIPGEPPLPVDAVSVSR